MSDKDQQALNSQAVPFFARFLEGQFCEDLSEKETEAVRGGVAEGDGIVTTLKYPNDQEEGGHGVTGYRFDREDGGYKATKKYPSDADEAVAVTAKYPSDGDDQLPNDYYIE